MTGRGQLVTSDERLRTAVQGGGAGDGTFSCIGCLGLGYGGGISIRSSAGGQSLIFVLAMRVIALMHRLCVRNMTVVVKVKK